MNLKYVFIEYFDVGEPLQSFIINEDDLQKLQKVILTLPMSSEEVCVEPCYTEEEEDDPKIPTPKRVCSNQYYIDVDKFTNEDFNNLEEILEVYNFPSNKIGSIFYDDVSNYNQYIQFNEGVLTNAHDQRD